MSIAIIIVGVPRFNIDRKNGILNTRKKKEFMFEKSKSFVR